MPVENKENKPRNPTVTAFFDAPVFGIDATEETPDNLVTEITTKAGRTFRKELGSAFTSTQLDAGALSVIQNAKAGDRLLLRQSSKLNKNGGRTFFLEVLAADANYGGKSSTSSNDGI